MHSERDLSVDASVFDRRTFLMSAGALALVACADDASDDIGTPEDGSRDVASTTGVDPEAASSDETGASGEVGSADDRAAADLPPLTVAQFAALPVCSVPPSTTAGPFPTLEQLDRRDVTEDYPGHPLRLGIRVVDGDCAPVPGAEVEIWHADATGDYSSYIDDGSGKDEGEGTTFLRGFQTADADGILEFQTIYPGWYEGRAVHIHVRARVDGGEVLTSQIYFDEDYTAAVLATGAYAEFGPADTSWADDGIARNPGTDGSAVSVTAAPTSRGEGTLGLINLGVPV